MNRKIDFYIKGLSFKVRQEIFAIMEDINPVVIKDLLEKEQGYPSLRLRGVSQNGIQEYINDALQGFAAVNNVMKANHRYPLFPNENDSYASALEYMELMKKREKEEAEKIFGCTWEEYQPRFYEEEATTKKKSDPDIGEIV